MISEIVKIHDKFTLEIKLGLSGQNKKGTNRFNINTWFFMPDSLDINRYTYPKDKFYRDIKSKIRLITPIFTLHEIGHSKNSPIALLQQSVNKLLKEQTEEAIEYVEYEVKMTISIIKSALRNSNQHILRSIFHDNEGYHLEHYIDEIRHITTQFRNIGESISKNFTASQIVDIYSFGDEYLSHLIETHCFNLINKIESSDNESHKEKVQLLIELIKEENKYQKKREYTSIDVSCKNKNRVLVARRGTLKKFLESELFLHAAKKEDSFLSKQLLYSLAAGISMIFATVVAFSFQQKYGQLTMPFFVALVISYMLKDRIKELSRYYFAHKLGNKYFDLKTDISIGSEKIGWVKEAFDYIPEEKVPYEVIARRNRSSLVEANNQFSKENIMLYRMQVETRNRIINEENEYEISGVNNILRINLQSLTHKMDNANLPLYYIDKDDVKQTIIGEKVYYVNFVIQIQHENQLEYHRFRVTLNREGILEVNKM